MSKTAVILPAYNEELTLKDTILSFHKELPEALIVIVDNNSKDKTSQIANDTFKEYGINGKLIFENRQGKANAVRAAFNQIDADIYIMSDADMTYPASEAHKLIEQVEKYNYDMVVGDRHTSGAYEKENKRALHNFGNNLVKNIVNKLFKSNLSDIMSGYRVFSRKFIKNYPILVEGFELETDMTLHALDKRFQIKEIPVNYKDRPQGSCSKLNTMNDGMRVIFTIFKIFRHYKPFMFFGSLSLIFAILSLTCGIPVLNDWFMYKYIYTMCLWLFWLQVLDLSVLYF